MKDKLKCEDCGRDLGHSDGTHKFWKCDKCYDRWKKNESKRVG